MQQNSDLHNWPRRGRLYPLGNIRQAVRLVASVCKMVREGILTADESLPGQSELSRRMRVSVAGVRLGMDVLSALEIVHIQEGMGIFVASGARRSILAGFEELADSQIAQRRRSCRVKQVLLGYAAARAARSFSHKEYVKLAESLGELYRASRNAQEYRLHRFRFQQAMVGRIRNRVLAELLQRIARVDIDVPWPGDAAPAALLQMAEQYRRIFWAIRDRNPERSCKAVQEHLLMTLAVCRAPSSRPQDQTLPTGASKEPWPCWRADKDCKDDEEKTCRCWNSHVTGV